MIPLPPFLPCPSISNSERSVTFNRDVKLSSNCRKKKTKKELSSRPACEKYDCYVGRRKIKNKKQCDIEKRLEKHIHFYRRYRVIGYSQANAKKRRVESNVRT